METVTVIGVFVIVLTTVVNLYLTYSRTHRQSGQRQKITSAAAVLLDQIAREVRTHEIAFWGTLDYNGAVAGGPNTLYEVDVADGVTTCESVIDDCAQLRAIEAGVVPYKTDIYRDERELVLYDNGGDESAANDKIIAYVYQSAGTDLCADDGSTLTTGFYRFYKEGTNPIYCQRLFDFTNVNVTNARFIYTQNINPYPDGIDPATDISSTRDADCGPGATAKFNGSFCECTIANALNNCFSQFCDVSTSGGSAGHCTFGENRQPAVTVYFTVGDANLPGSSLTFQTTITQRIYKR